MEQSCRAIKSIFFVFGMGATLWAPMIPFVKNRLGLDHAEFGLILSLSSIGTILALLISGWLIKRFGSCLVTVISATLLLSFLPMLTLASNSFYLGTTLFFFSGANTTMNIAINTQAVMIESQSKQPLMSRFHCLFSMGSFVGILLIGLLLKLNWSWFYCALLISLLIALIIGTQGKYLLTDKSPPPSSKDSKGRMDRGILGLGFLCLIAFMSEGCMANWSSEFLYSSLHYSDRQAGIGYALFLIAMVLSRLIGDKWAARYGQLKTFQISCFILAFGLIILSTLLWPYAELIGFLLAGFGIANLVPILLSLSGNFPKIAPYYALSIVTFFGYVGNLIGPVWMGFVANTFSVAFVFGCMAAAVCMVGFWGFPSALQRNPIS